MTEFLPSSLWFINQDQPRSLWLNVVPSKNFSLKLTDQQLRISVSLSLSAKKSKKPSCRCCKRVEENGHHSLSCAKSAGQFLRHHNLNTLVKQALTSIKVSSLSEPNGLTRTDGKVKSAVHECCFLTILLHEAIFTAFQSAFIFGFVSATIYVFFLL